MNAPHFSLDSIAKAFPAPNGAGTIVAIENISFSVNAGEYVSLLGRSGCGKSTLLYIIAGLEPPDSGTVLMHGEPVTRPDKQRMLMFQDAALFPWLSVLENVEYGLRYIPGLDKQARRKRALDFLAMVGLEGFDAFRIHELSGGMRQRVALARALAPDPEVLLMDEPFSALDAMTREQLYTDIQRLWRDTAKTVIMVTHNTREAACLSTRVILLDSPGKIVGDEPVPLEYPRSMNDVEVTRAASNITEMLHSRSSRREEACL
jgi:NitT/TauT family transport system ATP-binding protein